MKMKFNDVPSNCHVRYVADGKKFEGEKVDVDIIHNRLKRTFTRVDANQRVLVVFKSTWRVRCVLLTSAVSTCAQATCKLAYTVFSFPEKALYGMAYIGLTYGERAALSEESKPLATKRRYAKLQERYDEAFNTRTPDVTNATPESTGLLGSYMDDVPMVRR